MIADRALPLRLYMAKGETTMRFTSVTLGIVAISLLLLLLFLGLACGRFPARPLPTATLTMHSPLAAVPTGTPHTTMPTTVPPSRQESPIQAATPAVQTYTDREWQTFVDLEAGYSIRYPADFGFNAIKGSGEAYRTNNITFHLPNVNKPHQLSIEVIPNPDNLPIETIVKQIDEQADMGTAEIEAADALTPITIAGRSAYQTAILPDRSIYQPGNYPSKTAFHILLPDDDKVYHFALLYDSQSIPELEAERIYFQIVNTFELTDRVALSSTEAISTTVANSEDDWLTYLDQEAGYSLRYPVNSSIQGGKGREKIYKRLEITFYIPQQLYQGMSLQVEPNPNQLTIDKFLEERAQTGKEQLLDVPIATLLEEIDVAGMAAYRIQDPRAGKYGLYGNTLILLPYQDRVYLFSLGYTIAGVVPTSEAEKLFLQILDTFQILP